jgi:integrase
MANSNDTTYSGVRFEKDRHGRIAYAYHRKTRTRLVSPIGSPEFKAELDALNAAGRPSDNPRAGTLAALFDAYRDGPEFRRLSMRTQKDYETIFRYLKPGAERKLLLNFRVRDALEIRNATEKKRKAHFANYCITVLRLVLNWAKLYGYVKVNPLADLRLKLKKPHGSPKANRRWSPFECDEVLEAATDGIKVAIGLGMYLGMREGDALAATRLNYDGHRMTWAQRKTGEPIRLPVAQRLKVILDEALEVRPRENVEHLQLVLNRRGKPYTNDGFRTMLWKLIHKLEVAGKVMPGLTFHGLRHTAATTLAELGAPPHEIAALLGHRTLIMAAHYSAEANREKLGEAAIIRLANAPRTNVTNTLTNSDKQGPA